MNKHSLPLEIMQNDFFNRRFFTEYRIEALINILLCLLCAHVM